MKYIALLIFVFLCSCRTGDEPSRVTYETGKAEVKDCKFAEKFVDHDYYEHRDKHGTHRRFFATTYEMYDCPEGRVTFKYAQESIFPTFGRIIDLNESENQVKYRLEDAERIKRLDSSYNSKVKANVNYHQLIEKLIPNARLF